MKKFHDPLKTNRLKTFSNMCKKKAFNNNGRSSILKADRSLFGRIIVISQRRNLQMSEVLSHPLGPLPWALASPDGQLRKTNKSTLATLLQKDIATLNGVPKNCAVIIDGMALVQKLSFKINDFKFSDVAMSLMKSILIEARDCSRVDVVFDTYNSMSIKNCERLARHEDVTFHQLLNIGPAQIVRQWRQFLSSVSNKNSLIRFLVSEWQTVSYKEMLSGKVVYLTCEKLCYRIAIHGEVNLIPELESTHEEADGRLLLHAKHASSHGFTRGVQ